MAWNAKIRFYVAHVSQSGQKRWRWSAPLATAAAARDLAREKIANGNAVLSFVVRVEGENREIMLNRTEPASARKAIEAFEELLEMIDGFDEATDSDPEPGGRMSS